MNEVAAAKWYQLGIQLEIPVATLSNIEYEHPRDAQRCMTEILNWWLQNAPECSWEKLTEALEAMGGYRALVERLRKKVSTNIFVFSTATYSHIYMSMASFVFLHNS